MVGLKNNPSFRYNVLKNNSSPSVTSKVVFAKNCLVELILSCSVSDGKMISLSKSEKKKFNEFKSL